MVRKPRRKSSTGIYHVMLRGINRQTIFEDDEDRSRMLSTLASFVQDNKYKLYGYCINFMGTVLTLWVLYYGQPCTHIN